MTVSIHQVKNHPAYRATFQMTFSYRKKRLVYFVSGELDQCYQATGFIIMQIQKMKAFGVGHITLGMVETNLSAYLGLRRIFYTVRMERNED